MSTPLDDILSRGGETAPETTQETTQAPPAETPAGEQPSTEQTTTEETAPGKETPVGAIRQAEREKATKRYTEQVADFDRRLAEQNTAWERRFNQLLEAVKPQQQQQPVPDFFENPQAAVAHTIDERVGPGFKQIEGMMMHNSRLIASQLHTPELVDEAEQAFIRALESRQLDPADYNRVTGSPNRYDAAVRWHKRQQALAEIGDDPAQYKERLKAELLAQLQQAHSEPAQQQAAPVMPSNLATARNVGSRSGPAWAGPTPLNDIFDRKRTAR